MTAPAVQRGLVIVVALLAMIGPFTIDTYLPSFPDMEAEFGVSRALLSQSLGLYLAAFALATLLWGPLVDALPHRRHAALLALGGYALASVGCALAGDYAAFIAFRLLQGLTVAGGFIAGRALIRDRHDARGAQRAMSQVMMTFSLAPAVAPVLGGWLHDAFGWRSVFWFLTAYALALAPWVARLEESPHRPPPRSLRPRHLLADYRAALTHRRYLAVVACSSALFAGLFLYIVGAPTVVFDLLGGGVHDFAWLFVPMVAGMALGSATVNRLGHRHLPVHLIRAGLVLAAMAWALEAAMAWLAPAPFTLVPPLVLYAYGLALTLPGMGILAMDYFPENRGLATAFGDFLRMLTNAAVASLVVPQLTAQAWQFALAQGAFLALGLALWRLHGRLS